MTLVFQVCSSVLFTFLLTCNLFHYTWRNNNNHNNEDNDYNNNNNNFLYLLSNLLVNFYFLFILFYLLIYSITDRWRCLLGTIFFGSNFSNGKVFFSLSSLSVLVLLIWPYKRISYEPFFFFSLSFALPKLSSSGTWYPCCVVCCESFTRSCFRSFFPRWFPRSLTRNSLFAWEAERKEGNRRTIDNRSNINLTVALT